MQQKEIVCHDLPFKIKLDVNDSGSGNHHAHSEPIITTADGAPEDCSDITHPFHCPEYIPPGSSKKGHGSSNNNGFSDSDSYHKEWWLNHIITEAWYV